jgi:hypothetical protein
MERALEAPEARTGQRTRSLSNTRNKETNQKQTIKK